MSKALLRFIDEYGNLRNAARKRGDDSFEAVDSEYYKRVQQLANDQIKFKKTLKKMTIEEKAKAEFEIKSRYEYLSNKPQWSSIVNMKELFYNTVDPSLSEWLIKNYINGTIAKTEDIKSRLVPAIEDFNWLTKNDMIAKRKITTFGGLNELEDYLSKGDIPKQLEKHRGLKRLREDDDAELVHENEIYKVYHPKTQEAACHLGKGTRWCTAATKGSNMFDRYNADGPLYVIQPKTPAYNGEKYQVHFESWSLMDEKDIPVPLSTLKQKFPGIEKVLDITPAKERGAKFTELIRQLQNNGQIVHLGSDDVPTISNQIDFIYEKLTEEEPDADADELNDLMEDFDTTEYELTVEDLLKYPKEIQDDLLDEAGIDHD